MFADCQLPGSDCRALLLLTTAANSKLWAENARALRIYADSLTFNESLSRFPPHIWVRRHSNHYVLLITHYNVLPQIPPGFRSRVAAFRLNREAALNTAITPRSIVFVRKCLSEAITLSHCFSFRARASVQLANEPRKEDSADSFSSRCIQVTVSGS